MITKTVFQLDADGVLIGATAADESPLEPGVFLLPSGCVEIEPPPHVEGKLRVFSAGAWLYQDIPAIEPETPLPPPTIKDLKTLKILEINRECDVEIGVIRNSYPETEVLSWPKQEAEAMAMLLDSNAHTPLLDAIALDRGIDRLALAGKVIEKSDAYAFFAGAAFGKRQRLEDQINAIAEDDPEAVAKLEAIVW